MPGSFEVFRDRAGALRYRLVSTDGLMVSTGEITPVSHRLQRGPNPAHQAVAVLVVLVAGLFAALGVHPAPASATPVPAAVVRCTP